MWLSPLKIQTHPMSPLNSRYPCWTVGLIEHRFTNFTLVLLLPVQVDVTRKTATSAVVVAPTNDHVKTQIIMTVTGTAMITTVTVAVDMLQIRIVRIRIALTRIVVATETRTKAAGITEITEVTGMTKGEAVKKSLQGNHLLQTRRSRKQMKCGQSWGLLHLNSKANVILSLSFCRLSQSSYKK